MKKDTRATHLPPEQYLSKALEVLTEELDRARLEGQAQRYHLHSGVEEEERESGLILRFSYEEDRRLFEQETAILSLKELKLPVEVLEVAGHFVRLLINEREVAVLKDLFVFREGKRTIPEAELEINPVFLLERTLEGLHHLQNHLSNFNLSLAGEMLNGETKSLSPVSLPDIDLNLSQKEAIEKVFNHSVSFIWGPPGTGKTRTIGVLCAEFIRQKESVLLLSHANRAVDNALLAVVEALQERGMDTERVCTRFRHTTLKEEGKFDLSSLAFENFLVTLHLAREIPRLQAEKLIREWEDVSAKLRKVEEVRQTVHEMREKLHHLREEEPSGLKAEIRLKEERRKLDEDIRYAEAQLSRYAEKIKLTEERARILEKEIKSSGGLEVLKRRLGRSLEVDELEELSAFPLVATTLHLVNAHPLFHSLRFTNVVVDEASMASLPLIFSAAVRAKKRVVLVGDPQQLPPIVTSSRPETALFLEKDIFQMASSQEGLDPLYAWADQVEHVAFLEEQYRMPHELSSLVSSFFYHGKLKDGKDCHYPDAVQVLDTAPYQPQCLSGETDSYSHFNPIHIDLISQQLLPSLLAQRTQIEIGIITPYRQQASRLRRALREKGYREIEVGTVHTFQGREKKVIIFDTVISPPLTEMNWLNDENLRHRDETLRLLTVALSRAQERLFIVMNCNFIREWMNLSVLGRLLQTLPHSAKV